jgi:hypothetical protein
MDGIEAPLHPSSLACCTNITEKKMFGGVSFPAQHHKALDEGWVLVEPEGAAAV